MSEELQALYGRLMMTNIQTLVWMGDWKGYEAAIETIPNELLNNFSFHSYYVRDEVGLWYENYFIIPGEHYVSPYLTSHTQNQSEDLENIKKDLLCLIGIYDKVGFYYPLEKDMYPDHIGCLSSFLVATISEEIKALNNHDDVLQLKMKELEGEVIGKYMFPFLVSLQKQANEKVLLPFFREFIRFYNDMLKQDWEELTQIPLINS